MVERQPRESRGDVGTAGDDVEFVRVEVLRRQWTSISSAVLGVISDILIITRLPAANAADAGSTTRLSGKFHGPMIPTTPSGEGSTSALQPEHRAPHASVVVARIHCGTWDLVCSITEIMPSISVNNESRPGPGAEIGRHRVDERVGVVEHQRQ